MRLEIVYTTRYYYEPAVAGGLTAVRLRPKPHRGLNVHQSSLIATPGSTTGGYVDGWGTQVDLIECHDRHAELACEMRAIVDTYAVEEPEPLLPHEASIYRRESSRVRMQAVSALVATCGFDPANWMSVEAVNEWVNWRFTYRVGETDAETQLETVVETGLGVCQDFAHILIAMLRSWGWPARYVCGYQFAGEVEWGRIEDQAMHAWVEVHGPGVGWLALDPTTGKIADERYVPVGRGRDYDDVRPIRGVLRGPAPRQEHQSHLQMVVMDQQ